MLEKIKTLRTYINSEGLDIKIQVDGGINYETAAYAREAGADVLVSGSCIFSADDMSEAVEKIRGVC